MLRVRYLHIGEINQTKYFKTTYCFYRKKLFFVWVIYFSTATLSITSYNYMQKKYFTVIIMICKWNTHSKEFS